MPARPKILFLTHRVPYPPNRGDRIRSWNMLRYLSKQADVHLACLTDEPVGKETLQELDRVCERVAIQPLPGMGRWVRGAWSLLAGGSATEGLFKSDPLRATVREWAKETPFDAVLVFCSSMFQFADVQELNDRPLVVDLVDADSEKWLNYAETASFLKRQLYRLEAKRVRQLEKKIAEQADAVTLVSEEEVKVFRSFSHAQNVHAISNGVDLDYFHPAPEEYQTDHKDQTGPKPFKLVFVGVLDYRANIEGLHWFCREVWPQAREKIPGIELDLVGRRPGEAARELAKFPGINLIGEVDDVRPHVWTADVVIAPLTIARGIQNKVLEALAMAKPVIATPQAIAGTGAIPGKHLAAAKDAREWLSEIAHLFGNPNARLMFATEARGYVITQYKWQGQLAPLSLLLKLDEPGVSDSRFEDSNTLVGSTSRSS